MECRAGWCQRFTRGGQVPNTSPVRRLLSLGDITLDIKCSQGRFGQARWTRRGWCPGTGRPGDDVRIGTGPGHHAGCGCLPGGQGGEAAWDRCGEAAAVGGGAHPGAAAWIAGRAAGECVATEPRIAVGKSLGGNCVLRMEGHSEAVPFRLHGGSSLCLLRCIDCRFHDAATLCSCRLHGCARTL